VRHRLGFFVPLLLVTLFGAGAVAIAQQGAPHPVPVAMKVMPITVAAGEYSLINQVIDLPAGAAIPKHTHGGPAVVNLLSGQLTVTDATGTRTLSAGQSFTEAPGYAHSVANKGSTTARVSVTYLIPKGSKTLILSK